jgi:DNA-binding NtrC family response regulator
VAGAVFDANRERICDHGRHRRVGRLRDDGHDVREYGAASQLPPLDSFTRVDAVITDYNMPGKNGRQLIHETAARWPHMKFILVSGYLEDSEREQIEKEYGAQILNKPFHIGEAANLVAGMMGAASPRSSE